jgi:hypothetical protein
MRGADLFRSSQKVRPDPDHSITIRLMSAWLRRAVTLTLACIAGVALAAPPLARAADPPSALERFIGADGLGVGQVRRSDLEALWGRADIEKPVAERKAAWRNSHAMLEYKSRGLIFTTLPGSYGQPDPLIDGGTFSLPFQGCTPQGLCLDMSEAEAMPIISAHYKIRGDYATSFGHSGIITGRTWWGSNKGWRQTHHVSFAFDKGRLRTMHLQLEPTPFMTLKQLRSGVVTLLGFAVLVLIGLGLEAMKKHVEPITDTPAWEVGKLGLGIALLVTAVGGMAIGFGTLSSTDGYAKLVSLLMGIGAVGLLVVSLLVFSRSRNTIISRGAGAILLIGLILLAAAKLL